MTRALRTAVTALLLTLTSLAFTARPASAATCNNLGTNTVPNGYGATITCPGTGFIHGFGSTPTDATTDALLLYQLYLNYGYDCDGRGASTTFGGYGTTVHCADRGYTNGYGSTAAAAVNARLAAS